MSEEADSEGKPVENEGEAPGEVKLFPCPHCGVTNSEKYGVFDSSIKMASHVKYECEKAKQDKEKKETQRIERKIEAAKETARPPPPEQSGAPPTAEDLTPRQRVAMYGLPELEKIKKETLKKFLEGAPNISPKLASWILQQWDMDPDIRADPKYLHDLMRDSGVAGPIAYRAATVVSAIEDELRDVLDGRDYRFRNPSRRGPQERDSNYDLSFGRRSRRESYDDRDQEYPDRRRLIPRGDGVFEDPPTERRSQQPYGFDQMSWQIEREVSRATTPLLDKVNQLTEQLKESRKPSQEQMVEIWRPKTDAEGNIMTDAAGKPILDRISAPASIAGQFFPKEDPEIVFMKKLELMRSLNAPQSTPSAEELTPERIRSIIKEEKEVLTAEKVSSMLDEKLGKQPTTINPELSKMQSQMDDLTKELASTKDKMTEERFSGLNKQLEDMKTMMRNVSTGEFKEDGMRLLSKSMDDFTTLVKERKPLEKAMDKFMPDIPGIPDEVQPKNIVRTQTAPAPPAVLPKPVPDEAKKGPLTTMQKLGEEGYVVKK